MTILVAAQVVGEDGLRGRITDQVQADDGVTYVFVEFDGGERARIPTTMLRAQADGSLLVTLRESELQEAERTATGKRLIIPVIAEQLEVGKRTVETGRMRVRKVVREHEEVVDEPLFREEIDVKRVSINKQVDRVPEVRREGELVIVPVVEEVLVVEKRLILKEELHITRRQTTVHQPQQVTLRDANTSHELTRNKIQADRRYAKQSVKRINWAF